MRNIYAHSLQMLKIKQFIAWLAFTSPKQDASVIVLQQNKPIAVKTAEHFISCEIDAL